MIKRAFPYLLMLPAIANGDGGVAAPPSGSGAGQEYTFSFIQKLLCRAVDWVFTVSLIVGIAFVLFAGFTYMTSSGSEEKVSQANKSLLYAAIGILVAMLAKGVPAIIGNFVNASTSISACP